MSKTPKKYDFGMIGPGIIGSNLLLNMGDHGIIGADFDTDAAKAILLGKVSKHHHLKGFSDLKKTVMHHLSKMV
jgi:6-phosphogluconate dehydrogenase